jgi:hypothetical protein
MRDLVINPPQMLHHSKGIEMDIIWILFCPMKGGMNHESSCHIHDALNSSFSTSILVLGRQHWRRIDLLFPLTSAPKTPQQKRYHGHNDSVWLYRHIGCKATVWIKPYTWPILLHLEKLGSRPKKESWRIIIKDGTALKTTILWFMSIPGRHTSGRLTDELVCRDKLTYFVLIHRDSSLMIFN